MSLPTPIKQEDFTVEQLKLITDTVAKGATPDELKLFLYRCKNMGLDPLRAGQIYFVKYGNSPGTIVVGLDGFRSRAAKTGKLSGIKRGAIKNDKGALVGAWAEVTRSDWKDVAREEVPLAEYNTGKAMWAKMPETMIKKVAECAALRMAFPDELGGVYSKEEMDQAEKESHRVGPEQPPEDGSDGVFADSKWLFSFGKWTGKTLEQVYNDPANGPKEMANYINWIEDNSAKNKKPLTANAIDLIKHVEEFLGAMENRPLE